MPRCRRSSAITLVCAVWFFVADCGNVLIVDWVLDFERRWDLGKYEPGLLGLADRELCVLGRYRSRRNAYFRYLVFVSSELANKYQPCFRSNDDLCRCLRWDLSRDPRWSSLACVLAAALPKFKPMDVATISQPTSMGRFRSRDLRIDLVGFLVHGYDSRLGDLSRSKQDAVEANDLRIALPGMDRFIASLAALREGLYIVGGIGSSSGFVRSHGR